MTRCTVGFAVAFAIAIPAIARPVVSSTVLKSYFQTGDRPTQAQFSITSLTGDPSPVDPPDFVLNRGTGSVHIFEGIAGAEMLSDGNGHALILADGAGVRPTSGQFSSLIDSMLSIVDDRELIGLRFVRSDGVHYGFMDISIDSPVPGWPDHNALVIHGWAYESDANTEITAHYLPAPGTGSLVLAAVAACIRRRR